MPLDDTKSKDPYVNNFRSEGLQSLSILRDVNGDWLWADDQSGMGRGVTPETRESSRRLRIPMLVSVRRHTRKVPEPQYERER